MPITSDDLCGINIDVFHMVPRHRRNILADENTLPHKAIIQLGEDYLDLQGQRM